jgi:hypothetical protein
MDPASYRREDHDNACPCKLCVTFDIAFAMQETGAEGYRLEGLHSYITRRRNQKLNWELPDGHCILCGGTSFSAWHLGQHFEIHQHNTQAKDGKWFTSLLLHKEGAMFAVYRQFVERQGGWGKLPYDQAKARFIQWASHMMDLNPYTCVGYASRDIGDWIELRLGYTQLVEETREQRIERYAREAREDSASRTGKGPQREAGKVQGVSSLAWHINSVLASVPGRVPEHAGGEQDASAVNDRGGG